jgi:tripartite-type tricarboxylate transporter receptor subunit TctC
MFKALLILLITVCPITSVLAQAYPNKPIRFVVPYPPGGGTDLVGRTISTKISETLGQQVIVENRPGAQGNVGTSSALKSPPDGYTVVLSYVGTVAMNPFLYKSIGYDPMKDFSHISLATVQPYVVVVNPVVPVKNLKELAVLAKSQPGRLTFASSAAAGQLAGEFFKMLTNTNMLHIPFKGAGPAAINVIGGHVDLMFATPAGSVPQVKAGRLRALAVTASSRLSALPNVLTSKESGFPEFEISGWYGVAAPANTPKDIVARLNTAIVNALNSSDVRDRLINDGLEVKSNTPEEMSAFARSEYDRWGKVIKASGIKPE